MFVHLSVRSHYSFGCGTAAVESLCQRAQALGFSALALTEVNGLYSLGWFFRACQEYHLTPIVGAEVRHASGRAVLLPFDRTGYSHLCHILSARHLQPDFSLAESLLQWRSGLVIISDSFSLLHHLVAAGGRENLHVELRPGQNCSQAMALSRATGIPALVTNDVHFLAAGDYDLHVKLRAIALKKTRRTVPAGELASPEAWLKSAAGMEAAFASHPDALTNTARVAEQCAAFQLTFDRLVFPRFNSPEGKTAGEVLRALTTAAAQELYLGSPEVMARLEQELEIIIRKGFADTFLVMRDIVQQSEFTCGRGSAAASLVSYLLGLTAVDPISCDLYFGRFLNEARTDPPDIDMDFPRDERHRVIANIYARYGEQNVAMVANHNCMGMRLAIRRLAELEGMPQAEIALVTRAFSGWGGSIAAFYKNHPVFRGTHLSDKWPEMLAEAERLVGMPVHLSLHPGGMVIAPEGIDHYIPRQRSRNGIIAIQTEKDQTEDFLRHVKFDILGNTSLCVLRDSLRVIRARHGRTINYRDWRTFAVDPDTVALITQARTMACFHIESASFLQLLQKIGPALRHAGPQKIFDVLVILSSIIRPASNNNIREFLRRFHGGTFTYLHPRLEGILGETLGLPVYQEHVNLMAMALAGFSEVEADQLRKALTGKKSEKRIRTLMRKYVEGCLRHGVSREVAHQTAAQILQFVHYSFLKAHSASYVILALACTYLKAHYPAIFMAARLSYPGGFWGFRAYVSECQRMGLRVLLPDVNASQVECTGGEDEVRIGLMRLKGVGAKTQQALVQERQQHGRFVSLPDFLRRLDPAQDEMTSLILAGACQSLQPDLPPSALQYLHAYWVGLGKPRDTAEWYPVQREKARRLCQPYSPQERRQYEQQVFGTLLSEHPLAPHHEQMARLRRVPAVDLHRHAGRRVRLVGWPIAGKEVTTRTEEAMEFWAFEDETGVFHAVFFPRAYQRYCRLLVGTRPLVIAGIAQEEYGAVTVNVLQVEVLA